MRLRLTIQRHGLPETTIIWVVETTSSPTIAELLESVNESVPIESNQWGFEDYAVEVKGNSGVNYECLHYQQVAQVMKEDDEVIIRPLLTHDIRTRKRSGRHQISAEGYKLYDGLAYGKTLRKALANRPEVKIPPRKKRRVTYHDDEDEDDQYGQGGVELLAENPVLGSGAGDSNKQLILHADFDDDDEDDDEDFAPPADEDEEPEVDLASESSENENDSNEESESEEERAVPDIHLDDAESPLNAEDKKTLDGILDEATCDKVRKLHSAFPSSAMAVCNFILIGTEGDMDGAYEAMVQGFVAAKPKSAVVEVSKEPKKSSSSRSRSNSKKVSTLEPEDEGQYELGNLSIRKTRSRVKQSARANSGPNILSDSKMPSMSKAISKRKIIPQPEPQPAGENDFEDEDVEDEDDEKEEVDSKARYYDQNGFPPGSINAGKLTKFGPGFTNHSSSRPVSRRSNSVGSSKSVRFAIDGSLSKGLTSTPFIDQEEDEDDDGSVVSSDDSSEDLTEPEDVTSSSEESDSSDSDSDSDTSQVVATHNPTILATGSDSDSSTDSSSESSSDSSSEGDAPEEISSKPSVQPGRGLPATRTRNERRRNASRLSRYKEKGILPPDTTTKEFQKLADLNSNTSPEVALDSLKKLRTSDPLTHQEVELLTGRALAKTDEFERRRNELLASLAAGGIEVGLAAPEPLIAVSQQMSHQDSAVESFTENVSIAIESQIEGKCGSTASGIVVKHSQIDMVNTHASSEERFPSPAPEISSIETPVPSSLPLPASAESSQSTSVRRAKLDVGAGRRLLFGALGIKTPKTKKDEEQIRNSLMKDARPRRAPKEIEDPILDISANVTEEDPDAWRKTITYRAVECVQEGIELSEPPFPFIQRWDPQQQNPWKAGKRKKDQGDQADYVDDSRASKKQKHRKGKHNYQEEQEYLDESYQPSYNEDSYVTNYDKPSQLSAPRSDDVEDEISQQLMNEFQPSTGEFSQGPDDLAPLPENPVFLPDLEDGKSEVGMVIAYKTLECSAETRWQPQLSGYRTAIVIAIQENGQLHLTLAKRDRKIVTYDETTGERVYTQFEMVDVDDDDEDDGSVYLMFNEMREPKVVQEPPADLNGDTVMDETSESKNVTSLTNSVTPSHEEGAKEKSQEGAQEAQYSHVTETPLQSDAPEPEDDISETHMQSDAAIPEENEDNAAESPTQSDVQSRDQSVDDSIRSRSHSDDPDAQPHGENAAESPAPSDAGHDQIEDNEMFHEAQQEEDIPSNKGAELLEDAEVFHEAQVEAGVEEEETSPSPNAIPKASSLRPKPPSQQREELMDGEEMLPDTVSDESRRAISNLIKDAGFRSSIPSSIMRDTRPNGMDTPGDAAVFEKLLNDMEPRSVRASSPRSGDFGSSSPVRKAAVSSSHVNTLREQLRSPEPIQSSWVTVDEPISSQPLPTLLKEVEQQDSQDWETDSEDQPSSPPVKRPTRPEPTKRHPRKRVPIANAQAKWEELAGTRSKTNSPIETDKPSPEPKSFNEDEEEVELYPKLSTQSSFNSELAGYGRQPDFDSGDSAPFATFEDEDPSNAVGDSSAPDIEQDNLSRRNCVMENSGDAQTTESKPASKTSRLPSKSPISARIEELLNSPPKRVPRSSHIPEKTPSPEQAVLREESPADETTPTPKKIPAVADGFSLRRSPPKKLTHVLEESIAFDQASIPEKTPTVISKAPTSEGPSSSHGSPRPEEGFMTEAVVQLQTPFPEKVLLAASKRVPSPKMIAKKTIQKPAPVHLDSEDEFPDLEVLLSQSQGTPKAEKMPPTDSVKPNRTKTGTFGFDGASEDHDLPSRDSSRNLSPASQPRPSYSPASENSTKRSRDLNPQASRSHQSESRTIKTRDSQPLASQSRVMSTIPSGSQFIDLSLSSSDVEADEPEPTPAAVDSDDDPPSFNGYELDDDDDSRSWGVKKKRPSSVFLKERKKKASENGLRNSSRASLNTQNKRKTSSKY